LSAYVGKSLGRYRLEELLGQGGMAEVHRATDTKLARTVAVKVILATHAIKGDFLERFLREARMVASLEHPNILPVYDFGEDNGVPFLVMPYLSGGSLRERLKAGAAPLALASAWIAQLADALDAAHAAGVLHRDVKPANVLVDRNDRLFLADFGIAKMLENQSGLTATGVVVGTPIYMAPEQAQGRPATPATDRYALAVVAYENPVRPPSVRRRQPAFAHAPARVEPATAALDAHRRPARRARRGALASPRERPGRAAAHVPRPCGSRSGFRARGDHVAAIPRGPGRSAGLDDVADDPLDAGTAARDGGAGHDPVGPAVHASARAALRRAAVPHERRDGSHELARHAAPRDDPRRGGARGARRRVVGRHAPPGARECSARGSARRLARARRGPVCPNGTRGLGLRASVRGGRRKSGEDAGAGGGREEDRAAREKARR
jgi:hypothetical protein